MVKRGDFITGLSQEVRACCRTSFVSYSLAKARCAFSKLALRAQTVEIAYLSLRQDLLPTLNIWFRALMSLKGFGNSLVIRGKKSMILWQDGNIISESEK